MAKRRRTLSDDAVPPQDDDLFRRTEPPDDEPQPEQEPEPTPPPAKPEVVKVKVGYYISEPLYDFIERRYHEQRMSQGKTGKRISRSSIVEELLRRALDLPPLEEET